MGAIQHDRPFFFHFRPKNAKGQIDPRSGVTVAYDPTQQAFGTAVCDHRDNFKKADGRAKALGRARSDRRIPSVLTTVEQVKEHAALVAEDVTVDTSIELRVNYRKLKISPEEIAKKIEKLVNSYYDDKAIISASAKVLPRESREPRHG